MATVRSAVLTQLKSNDTAKNTQLVDLTSYFINNHANVPPAQLRATLQQMQKDKVASIAGIELLGVSFAGKVMTVNDLPIHGKISSVGVTELG